MSKSALIGLTKLVYAKLISDTPPTSAGSINSLTSSNNGAAMYSEVIPIKGAITAKFVPKTNFSIKYADNDPYESAATLGDISLELRVADIPPAICADILGIKYERGILQHTIDIRTPYVAIGMQVAKSNGAARYVWFLKGKFIVVKEEQKTKTAKPGHSTQLLFGNFFKRAADNQWKIAVDTDDENVSQETLDDWFTTPNAVLNDPYFWQVAPPIDDMDLAIMQLATDLNLFNSARQLSSPATLALLASN